MQNFDVLTLVFLGLAIFVIYKLRSVLGQRTGTEKPPQDMMIRREQANDQPAPGASNSNVVPLPTARGPQPAAEPEARLAGLVPAESPAFPGLVQIMQSDATFDPREFLGGARAAYEMIVMAFAQGDRRTLKDLLSPEVYEGFEGAIKDRESRNEKVETQFVSIDKAEFSDALLRTKTAQVTVNSSRSSSPPRGMRRARSSMATPKRSPMSRISGPSRAMSPRGTRTGVWWRPRRLEAARLAVAGLLAMSGLAAADPTRNLPPLAEQAELRRLAFSDLPGWAHDDASAAFRAFLETCKPLAEGAPAQRLGVKPPDILVNICRKALSEPIVDSRTARAFFETHFQAFEVQPKSGNGFLTAYFEPEILASRVQTPEFPVPVLGRPADLVTFAQDEPRPQGIDAVYAAARVNEGVYSIFPDRAAIWGGALTGQGLEIAWLRDEAELFITQVQGSARLTLTDGTRARLTYAGGTGIPIPPLAVSSSNVARFPCRRCRWNA